MKFALLGTTLLALFLTSTCIASALQSIHEDGGGYSDKLVKRYLSESSSENSPPTPPRQGLERGNSDTFVRHIREERRQSADGPSHHLNYEKTDDEETESDSWRKKGYESVWGNIKVPMTMSRGRKHFKDAQSSSNEPSKETRKRFKIVPSAHKRTSTSPSSSRTPSAYATSSSSSERPARAFFASHDSMTQSVRNDLAFDPWEQRKGSSTGSSGTPSIPQDATSTYYDTPGDTQVSSHHSMTSADDEIPTGEWRQRQDLQRGKGRMRSNGKRQNISFRHYFGAKEHHFTEEAELTPEQFSLLSLARTRQDFDELASNVLQFPFKLTTDQKKKIKDQGKVDPQFKYEFRNFRKNNNFRARRRKKTWQTMQTQGSFDAPESYQGLEDKELRKLRIALMNLLDDIHKIQRREKPLNLVDGQRLRPVDQWTQEDLNWWTGFIEFRRAFYPLRQTGELLKEIEYFYTKGKGIGLRPPNETNKGKKIQFRPAKAYKEADRKST
ncbi:hypothetical protein FA10DRAFT_295468 [Acaromyces ingoldii]|uniref:Uncharacterized protein n=1 Tax=Acaromyces ingoldii TaxID=215250 RepID=A0A316YNM5_9BASI|nr:hypothetical protein FA10DRAFT_295468 [Acaromyces ingoldii]PWN89653.1 hypothetical protein FA10DRAFT_295468 [Acaromyces ingoldii]